MTKKFKKKFFSYISFFMSLVNKSNAKEENNEAKNDEEAEQQRADTDEV